jgi:hypothetical protein
MSVKDIAYTLVELCRAGRNHEASEKLHSDDIVSIEAMAVEGMDPASHGREAVAAKGKWWADNHEVKGVEVDGPYVNGDQFTVHFTMDVVVKATGDSMHMKEIALYTVKGDKIVEEKFFYGM